MKNLIKNAREKKGLKTRELALLMCIDQALISKFESGTRKPTQEQVVKLASLLDIDLETLMVTWLKEKIIHEIGQNEFALKALQLAEEELRNLTLGKPKKLSKSLEVVLSQISVLKAKWDRVPPLERERISQAIELEYTFESNRIEGNTMTVQETELVINQGLTIAGKSMREHLEIINHQEAIALLKALVRKSVSLTAREVLALQSLIVRGIHPEDAGRYRRDEATIEGSAHRPPSPFLIADAMEGYFIWYETHKNKIHPVVLAAEMHERLIGIYPFGHGNGKTARLVLNLILLQHGYVIASSKGDTNTRIVYHQAVETAQTHNNKEEFIALIAEEEKESLERHLCLLSS